MDTFSMCVAFVLMYLFTFGLSYLMTIINIFANRMWVLFLIGGTSYACYYLDKVNHDISFSSHVLLVLAFCCFGHLLNQLYEYFMVKCDWEAVSEERSWRHESYIDFYSYFREESKKKNYYKN